MNPAPGSGNGGFNGGGGGGHNGQVNQNALQQQLVQQLSQQLSQQMSQKFPQANILSALANVQSQMQGNPQQQLPPDLLALARSGNLAGVAGLLNNAGGNDPSGQNAQQQQQSAPPPPQQQQAAAAPPVNQGDDVRQRLLQQLSKTAPAGASTKDGAASAPPAVGHVGGEVRAGFQGQPSGAASANLTADAVKDERRKAPGSVIVPCRARGMPMDHNFKTAYFVIPENVRHGEELICSYFACRNAGVKFRYCSHCKVPVAKRNFRKRHKHGDNLGKDGGDDDDQSGTEEDGCSDEGESNEVQSEDNVPSQVTTTGRSRKEAIPSQVTTTTEERVSKKSRSEERSKKSHIPSQVTTSSSGKKDKMKKNSDGKAKGDSSGLDSNTVCMRSGDDRSKVIESRRKRWAHLLEKRPQTKDGEAMSSWLMQVLAVSDLWKPLNESEKTPDASLDLIRECAQAGTEKKKKAVAAAAAATARTATTESTGASEPQAASSPPENKDRETTGNSSNESDIQENETEGRGTTDEERRSTKKKSLLLKKRPVVAVQEGEEGEDKDKGEPPTSKPKKE